MKNGLHTTMYNANDGGLTRINLHNRPEHLKKKFKGSYSCTRGGSCILYIVEYVMKH